MKIRGILLLFSVLAGWCIKAQVGDTLFSPGDSLLQNLSKYRYSAKQLYVPGALLGGGMATFFNKKEGLKIELMEFRQHHFSSFRTKMDNYLQFSPLIATYALEGFGVPAKTDFANQTVLMFKSEGIMLGATYLLKSSIHEMRPDGSNDQSFPSGHTAQAFMAATVLSEEYGYRYKWLPYLAYGIASGTGLLRIANNKHYICDVLVGAAIGILSVKVAYWTHQYKWGRHRGHAKPLQGVFHWRSH